ncbi:hypothetical protein [Falsirhodobacter sp. 1013]|uniref:hypothetical protein n=1 Tax=Falsirhodobacter sp. 1013 TaxID=3417566 RepID=UPI003EBB916B
MGVHVGRHAIASGQNYNRNFTDLAKVVAAEAPRSGNDAGENTAVIQEAMLARSTAILPKNEVEDMRRQLMQFAADVDYVYDMHAEEDVLFAAVIAPFTLPFATGLLGDMRPALTFWADHPLCSIPRSAVHGPRSPPRIPIVRSCRAASRLRWDCAVPAMWTMRMPARMPKRSLRRSPGWAWLRA